MTKIYNSLTKQKEEFKPIHPAKVNMYVCGMTVYDYCHIGHARTLILFDVVVRYLRGRGYDVHYVRNITDVDDKIIERANKSNEDYRDLTERFIHAMHEDEEALAILPPSEEPRATDHILEMLNLIKILIEKGFAYVAETGDVCYAIKKFPTYGALSQQSLEKLHSGARVAVAEGKRDPQDFVLWKLAKPGEPSWDSPWGKGRPGWHIECSAMSMHCLGECFDIHGGGFDLIFPHHENEIAQAEGATGKPFVNLWMHAGFLQINKEKMSKSLGNFLTIREALKMHSPEVLRYFLLSGHYRSPLNYSDEAVESARMALERLYLTLRGLPVAEAERGRIFEQRFIDAMEDDFNTPEALAALFDLAREINRMRVEDLDEAARLGALLKKLAENLGVLQQDPEKFLRRGLSVDQAEIEILILARDKARNNKDWNQADRIRDQLISKGIVLEDTPDGTAWRRE